MARVIDVRAQWRPRCLGVLDAHDRLRVQAAPRAAAVAGLGREASWVAAPATMVNALLVAASQPVAGGLRV